MKKGFVCPSDEWLQHIYQEGTPESHKMFTEQSYHDSFWRTAEHGIVLCDTEGNIIACNPYFLDLVESQLDDVLDKSIYNLISERFLKQDYTNIKAIINSRIYSYSNDNELINHDGNELIPVRIVATRVPSSLHYPFKHLIIHFYEMKKTGAFEITTLHNRVDEMTWKKLVMQPWFIKCSFAIIALIVVLISISGQLFPILQKLLEKF